MTDSQTCSAQTPADNEAHTAAKVPRTPRRSAPGPDRRGSYELVAAALLWIPQAYVIATFIEGLAVGETRLSPALAALLIVVIGLFRAALQHQSQRVLSRAANARLLHLRQRITAREARAASAAARGGPGALAALSSEKLEALRPYALRYRPARLRAAILPPLILVIAFSQSWAIGLVLLVAGPLIPVFMALVGWAAQAASRRQMVEVGALSDLLADRLAALADLRLIGAGSATVDGFAEASSRLRGRTMEVLRIAFLSSTVLELFAALGVAMTAVWTGFSLLGAISWGSWGSPLTAGTGVFLLLLAPEFFQPLRDLAAAWHDKAAAEAVEQELREWEEDPRQMLPGETPALAPHTRRSAQSVPKPQSFNEIRITALTLVRGTQQIAYPDFTLRAGQSLALTGASGTGKSSLLRALAALEPPAGGQILIDGAALATRDAAQWRAGLGWMPQSQHFLNRSLRHNISFGAPLRPEVIVEAQLGQVIAGLPQAGNTVLGERGAGLSGGEARRVMLARALHANPLLLLADEPTADLDRATAEAIGEALLAYVKRGGMLVLATHDEALAARMTQRIMLAPPPPFIPETPRQEETAQ